MFGLVYELRVEGRKNGEERERVCLPRGRKKRPSIVRNSATMSVSLREKDERVGEIERQKIGDTVWREGKGRESVMRARVRLSRSDFSPPKELIHPLDNHCAINAFH